MDGGRRDLLKAGGAAIAAGLAGCSGLTTGTDDETTRDDPDVVDGSTTADTAADETTVGSATSGTEEAVRIGGVYLTSGLAEPLGAPAAAAAEVAVDAINEAGGIDGREVELRIRDHGDNPQQQLRDLVTEFGANAMLGLTSSGVALNSGPTIERLGVPFVLTDVSSPFVTEPDAERYGDYYESADGRAAALPNLFRTNATTTHTTYAIASFVAENYTGGGGFRIANAGPDYAYGQQCWEYVQAFMDGLGVDYEVVASEFPEVGAADMTPHVSALLEGSPDLVFTSFWGNDAVTFVEQATEQGLFDRVDDVFDTIGADPGVFEALGATMPEGVHYSGWYWPGAYDTDANRDFVARYRAAHRDDDLPAYPSIAGGSTWAAVHVIKETVEAAGSTDPDDVVRELEGYTYDDDPRGRITLEQDSHQATTAAVIGETSRAADVPYDGVGLTDTRTYSLDRETASNLLDGTELPPGL